MQGWAFPRRGWWTWEVGTHGVSGGGPQVGKDGFPGRVSSIGIVSEWAGAFLVDAEKTLRGDDDGVECRLKTMKADDWIQRLGLEPHPEGGYFRQTYKSEVIVPVASLPAGFGGPRAVSTGIYFLLVGENFSALHRLRSDEMWHFYAGSALAVHVIEPDGKYSVISLGTDLEVGQAPQAVVRAGCWFGSHVEDWKGWALVGCTVAPGFDFAEFELGKREKLEREFPGCREIVRRLTRE